MALRSSMCISGIVIIVIIEGDIGIKSCSLKYQVYNGPVLLAVGGKEGRGVLVGQGGRNGLPPASPLPQQHL